MTVTPYSSAAPLHPDVTAPAPQVPAADTAEEGFFGSDGLNFDDFLDLINPLQHLPIISTFYRAATGDEISIGSRVLGGALFGGIFGFVAAMVNAFIADTTGKDIGEHVLALFDDSDAGPQVATAAATQPPATSASGDAQAVAPGLPAKPATPGEPEPAGQPVALASATAPTTPVVDEREDDPAQTPPWLMRTPQAQEDYTTMAARFGTAESATGWVLLVLGQALDKYENVRYAHDTYERRPITREPVMARLDTIV